MVVTSPGAGTWVRAGWALGSRPHEAAVGVGTGRQRGTEHPGSEAELALAQNRIKKRCFLQLPLILITLWGDKPEQAFNKRSPKVPLLITCHTRDNGEANQCCMICRGSCAPQRRIFITDAYSWELEKRARRTVGPGPTASPCSGGRVRTSG